MPQELTARLSALKALGVVDGRPATHGEVSWFLTDAFQDKFFEKLKARITKQSEALDLSYEIMCELLIALPITGFEVQKFGEVLWPIMEKGARKMWTPTLEAA